MSIQDELEKFRDGLVQQRDELLVQANLAKLEIKDEWDKAEAKLDELKLKLDGVADEAKEASEDVWVSMRMLGEEVRTAYERIKGRL